MSLILGRYNTRALSPCGKYIMHNSAIITHSLHYKITFTQSPAPGCFIGMTNERAFRV